MNHVTKEERQRIHEHALTFVRLNDEGQIIGGLSSTAKAFAAKHNISRERARRHIARAARKLRHPDYQQRPIGPPRQMEDGRKISVYLPDALIEKAKRIGDENLSAGVRRALEEATIP